MLFSLFYKRWTCKLGDTTPRPEEITSSGWGDAGTTGLQYSISPRLSLLWSIQISLFQRIQPTICHSGIWSVCGPLKFFTSSLVAALLVMHEVGAERKSDQSMSLPCGFFKMSSSGGVETYSAINTACEFCSQGQSGLLYRDSSGLVGGNPMKPSKGPADFQDLTILLHR